MSNNIRIYKSSNGCDDMYVTSFFGGKYGHSVQFTINGSYCPLAENQVSDLIKALRKRLAQDDKYKSTSSDLDIEVFPEEIK